MNRLLFTDIALQGEYVATCCLDPIEIKFIMLQRSESLQKQYPFCLPRISHVIQPFISKVQKEQSEVMYQDIFHS